MNSEAKKILHRAQAIVSAFKESFHLRPESEPVFDQNGRLRGDTSEDNVFALTANSIITHPSYGQIHSASSTIADAIKRTGLDLSDLTIIGVARGGLFPAVVISHALGSPMRVAHYSSKTGNGDDKNHSNLIPYVTTNNVLLVDDIFDSGNTMSELYEEFTRRNHNTLTAVLYYKENVEKRMPDFYWHHLPEDAPWIIFPYEEV